MAVRLPNGISDAKITSTYILPPSYWLWRCRIIFFASLGWAWPTWVAAQTPVGDGLRGEYYDGLASRNVTNSRTDGLIKFSWRGVAPIRGVAAKHFTVRWQGWLVPPVTGSYILHLDADDGVNLWLENRELISGWRGRSMHSYQVPVQLQAGHAYALRLDYLQYEQLAYVHLRWQLPLPPALRSSWRTLWGVTDTPMLGNLPSIETIPTKYLFTRWPATTILPTVERTASLSEDGRQVVGDNHYETATFTNYRFLDRLAVSPTHLPLGARLVNSSKASNRAVHQAFRPPPMRIKLHEVLVRSSLSTPRSQAGMPNADTLAARLAAGQVLTLRTLYFTQSKADLLPRVQESLDTLAQAFALALHQHKTLLVEIQGHTDNQGDSLLNQQLSQRRAEAVCHYLMSRGIPATCLRAVGFGGTQPIADNRILAQRPRNRRVVLCPLR